MTTRFRSLFLGFSLLAALFAIAGQRDLRASEGPSNSNAYKQLSVFSYVLKYVDEDYVVDPNLSAVSNGAMHGLLESLDSESSYLSAEENAKLAKLKEQPEGLGAALSKRAGYGYVLSINPGGPAEKAGLESGDIIESINGASTHEIPLPLLRAMFRGAQGQVKLSVIRARKAQPIKVTITLGASHAGAVVYRMEAELSGYIKTNNLEPGRSAEIVAAVRALQAQGAHRLILDLRNCGSGDYAEAAAAANVFLNHGLIAKLRGQTVAEQSFNAEASRQITNLPVAVLINRSTAGPAEVLAAAILENKRGEVVGEKSFGAASQVNTIQLQDGSALALSVARYYTPSGKAILADSPVTPDVLVEPSLEDYYINADGEAKDVTANENKPAVDDVLKKAIETLKVKEAKAA